MIASVSDLIRAHENRERFPYTDTAGKVSIGEGFNLTDVGLYDNEIDFIKANRIAIATAACVDELGGAFSTMELPRQAAIVDMAYNLGEPKLDQFKLMLAAIRSGDWTEAAAQALSSQWASQVPTRAKEDAAILLSGEWPNTPAA